MLYLEKDIFRMVVHVRIENYLDREPCTHQDRIDDRVLYLSWQIKMN